MKRLIDLTNEEARLYFLKGSSYFNADMPQYIDFQPVINNVANLIKCEPYVDFNRKPNPSELEKVNHTFLSNKDGKFAWRPLELIHPVIYTSLVNLICNSTNWGSITSRLSEFQGGIVECCSIPVVPEDHEKDAGLQVENWWMNVEQKSLCYSLEFSHLLHTDVTDCYGSLYTHSISWAIHTIEIAKEKKNDHSLLGNNIDFHIRAGRYGQTNGISQGSVLMDFLAEIVLGYLDEKINETLIRTFDRNDIRILRYRDDYRIFSNSDETCEQVLRVISETLSKVGMRLGASKTTMCHDVVEGSIKPDKLAGIDLQDIGKTNAKSVQKQLLRLHSFGQHFPNSGALRRLMSQYYTENLINLEIRPNDLEVQIAIATDIGYISPSTFPAVAAILSKLISFATSAEKTRLWEQVRKKMARVPNNGYLEIWLQRVVQAKGVGLRFDSDEPICKIVNYKSVDLWENSWIKEITLKNAVDSKNILTGSVSESEEIMEPMEIELFTKNANFSN